MAARSRSDSSSRVAILGVVKTPLSFFVLFMLVGEAALGISTSLGGVTAANFLWGTALVLGLPGVAVLLLTVFAPDALLGRELAQRLGKPQFLLYVGPPIDMPDLDILRIRWDQEKCFIVGGDFKERAVLVPAKPGHAFRVNFPVRVLDRLSPEEPLELELCDRKGYRWEVKPFYLLENLVPLSLVEPRERIIGEYGESDE